MLYTKILGSGEEDLKYFTTLLYRIMAVILINGAEPCEQIVKTPSTEGPM